ncbi:MAG TPA: radical SAM protein [Candidatus Aminicenantes bacterium]|nr:radical SAM protein [Candidatus Aminicenantes bacterium]
MRKSPVKTKSQTDPRLGRCTLCPRRCGANRFAGPTGICHTGAGLEIAAVCRHAGEEPVLAGPAGVCNVFFCGCNLRCVFCQNHQVSRGGRSAPRLLEPAQAMDRIRLVLDGGCDTLGLVSPSHVVPQVQTLLDALEREGRKPTVIHNGNGYDDPRVLRELAGRVDIYLPDLKYALSETAARFSGAPDYVDTAFNALEEMVRQVGTDLKLDGRGLARRGLIVRHLVLPGCTDDSIALLKKLAGRFGTDIHLSLMAQYRPPAQLACPPPLHRRLGKVEYNAVADEALRLGFSQGWFQEPGSADSHVPDFRAADPFGNG